MFYSQVLHPKIKVIDLSECDISDRCLESVAVMCPNLRKIDLNSAKQNRITISSRGISSVLLFIVMEYVCLRHFVKLLIYYLGVIFIAEHCPNLQVVYLRRCLQLTDEAIVRLSECCSNLRDLNIGGCQNITDRSLVALGQNSRYLRSVNIGHSNVSGLSQNRKNISRHQAEFFSYIIKLSPER